MKSPKSPVKLQTRVGRGPCEAQGLQTGSKKCSHQNFSRKHASEGMEQLLLPGQRLWNFNRIFLLHHIEVQTSDCVDRGKHADCLRVGMKAFFRLNDWRLSWMREKGNFYQKLQLFTLKASSGKSVSVWLNCFRVFHTLNVAETGLLSMEMPWSDWAR